MNPTSIQQNILGNIFNALTINNTGSATIGTDQEIVKLIQNARNSGNSECDFSGDVGSLFLRQALMHNSDISVIRALICAGADVDDRSSINRDHINFLLSSLDSKNTNRNNQAADILNLLISNGARVNFTFPVYMTASNDLTPLACIVSKITDEKTANFYKPLLDSLLEAGAKVEHEGIDARKYISDKVSKEIATSLNMKLDERYMFDKRDMFNESISYASQPTCGKWGKLIQTEPKAVFGNEAIKR
jgi:hypothetical protein